MNNGQFLINVAEAGLGLSLRDHSEHASALLTVLLDIEDALDQGRGLLFDSQDLKTEVNALMDGLRKRIREILDTMNKEEAKHILEERGERLKTQFSITL